ncbi:Glycosyltransferase involved in cell wall bisynthesis [Rhodoblastus acidophilus]|uniref:Glycosyltransferase involved in cell wall bisynthesis n=2 Tax=Rhodoblastus acidophilus TaxID=1074 RepID=A0A212R2D9_RHOAC|nr:glycosyltransferase [Rhodoblastus acidophilus]PPQ40313.1 hypothetical protein CKO16_00705 [Rhodoblastus acidophilus]SNB66172.1 Glycosyltransferase involved in cell wall bisynthesis [Rhodoblastus acidophilus]
MQDRPLVSVVIPSYNHVKYIGRAIDSALGQSWPHVEVVVIDDGSHDGSHEFVKQRYGQDPRVKATRRDNRGAHQTLNEAMATARGAYLSILNSDDFYEPTRLARLVEAAERRDGPFFAITGLRLVDESGTPFDPSSGYNEYYDMVCRLAAGKPDLFGFWCGNIAMTTSNFFFSRSALDALGPFRDLRYAHDWDWALRASARFNVLRLDEPLLNYRIHGGNTILESDPWAHRVEDAFVWASALRAEKIDVGAAPEDYLTSLAANWGFPLLPTLYLLADRRGEAEQLRLIATGALQQEMKVLSGQSDPLLWEPLPGALRELRDMRARLEPRAAPDETPAAQELASIKTSLAWKLVGWLWRLETRKARKARRRAN